MWMTTLFLGTAALFVAGAGAALWHLRWLQRLPPLDSLRMDEAVRSQGKPHCSVIVAARDDELTIEQTVRGALAQRGVEMELIVVDDRSADRTGEILKQLAKEDSRLKVTRVDVLPEGWLGKCHACHVGASMAKGEWILFIDADSWLTPEVLFRATRVAEQECALRALKQRTVVLGNRNRVDQSRREHSLFHTLAHALLHCARSS